MEQKRFFRIMSNSSSYNNINGFENIKEKNMSFNKVNDQPGMGKLQLRDNNIMKEYLFSDHPIVHKMRTGRKKRGTLKKRLEQFLIQHRNKKRNKTKKQKRNKTKKKQANTKKKQANTKKKQANTKKKQIKSQKTIEKLKKKQIKSQKRKEKLKKKN